MKTLEFYFDPLSPYVWLAWRPLLQLKEQFQIKLNPIPVLFAGLLNAHVNKGPAEISAKRKHVYTDSMRWAKIYGLNFEGPPAHPFNPLKALRICVAIEQEANREKWIGALVDAIWAQGHDMTNDETLISLADSLSLNGRELINKTQDPAVKAQLKTNTEQAIAKGVFGVPTFIVDQELFWGHDRIQLVEAYLRGELNIDHKKLEEISNRPRAADRPNIKRL